MTVEDFTRYRRLLAAHDEMRRQCVQQADETHSQRMKKFDCMRDAERAEKPHHWVRWILMHRLHA